MNPTDPIPVPRDLLERLKESHEHYLAYLQDRFSFLEGQSQSTKVIEEGINEAEADLRAVEALLARYKISLPNGGGDHEQQINTTPQGPSDPGLAAVPIVDQLARANARIIGLRDSLAIARQDADRLMQRANKQP